MDRVARKETDFVIVRIPFHSSDSVPLFSFGLSASFVVVVLLVFVFVYVLVLVLLVVVVVVVLCNSARKDVAGRRRRSHATTYGAFQFLYCSIVRATRACFGMLLVSLWMD